MTEKPGFGYRICINTFFTFSQSNLFYLASFLGGKLTYHLHLLPTLVTYSCKLHFPVRCHEVVKKGKAIPVTGHGGP
jgi:hypothetical protein